MGKRLDLSGQRFGKWTVLHYSGRNKHGHRTYLCQCDCEETGVIIQHCLTGNKSKQCTRCSRKISVQAMLKKGHAKHGMRYTPEYATWKRIKNRCFNPNCKDYKNYGGRGITLYNEWEKLF